VRSPASVPMSSEGTDAVKGEVDQVQGLVPKLRFPEFRDAGDWHEVTLGEVLSPASREIAKPDSDYTGLGLRSHGKGTFQKVGQDPDKNAMDWLYVVHRNDLIVNITFAWEGAIAIAEDSDHGSYVSHRFPTYEFKAGVSFPNFFRYVITDKAFVYRLGVISPGGAGRNRVMSKNDFLRLTSLLPSIAEQQKIADCLSSLDALIAAEGDRLSALKDHKKGLMQQLFPAAGQTTPRFRFPEFRDAGDWTEQSLSDRIELISGLHLSPDEYDEVGDLPYFSGPADFTDNVANVRKWTNRRGNAALAGDIVIVVKGSGVGDFWRLALPRAAIGRQLMAIRAPAETSGFLYQALSRTAQHLKSRASGNLIPGLARPDILEMKVSFPPTHEEQVMISKCLTEVDTLIDDTCGKIETLKAHKSGLMQQLFPAPSEAST